MAKTIVVKNGQTIWDITIQEYGDINQVFNLLTDNSLDYTSVLSSGQKLIINNEDKGNKSIQEFFQTKAINPKSIISHRL